MTTRFSSDYDLEAKQLRVLAEIQFSHAALISDAEINAHDYHNLCLELSNNLADSMIKWLGTNTSYRIINLRGTSSNQL